MARSSRKTGGRGTAVLILGVSLVAAAGFTFVIYKLIQSYQDRLAAELEADVMQEVVVAARILHQGETLIEEDLLFEEYPPAFVPDTTFSLREDVIGRVPRERVLEGEFVREERLADPESGVGLNAIIPRGMRALSINITDGSAVSGFLNPGNYVDVLVTIMGTEKFEKTVTLMQACYVLAVNTRMGGGSGGTASARSDKRRIRPSVTLAVTPDQAELLAHSALEGEVTLTLRNDIDVTKVETHGTTAASLLGEDGGAMTIREMRERETETRGSSPAPVPQNVKEIRGSKSSERRR